jgi:hypothetical protein
MPPRPVTADYPHGVPVNAAGRITHDIDGRPLTAPLVAGRSQVVSDGSFPDRGFDPAAVVRVGTEAGGARFLDVARSQIPARGDGYLRLTQGEPPSIGVAKDLATAVANKVRAHVVGHLVDEIAGRIDAKGLTRELEPLYSRLLTGEERMRHLTKPGHVGYRKDEAPRESSVFSVALCVLCDHFALGRSHRAWVSAFVGWQNLLQ